MPTINLRPIDLVWCRQLLSLGNTRCRRYNYNHWYHTSQAGAKRILWLDATRKTNNSSKQLARSTCAAGSKALPRPRASRACDVRGVLIKDQEMSIMDRISRKALNERRSVHCLGQLGARWSSSLTLSLSLSVSFSLSLLWVFKESATFQRESTNVLFTMSWPNADAGC